MHQDLSNNSATTPYYQEKENTNQEIPNFIKHNIQQIYNNLHHFDNDIVQDDNGNIKTKQIQRTWNVRRSQSVQAKSEEISSLKLFHGAPFSYFLGTCKPIFNLLFSV